MKIKERPEDFLVEEVADLSMKGNGGYVYYLMEKCNRESFEVFEEISRRSGIALMDIGYAGMKDKMAVTKQYISVPSNVGGRLGKLEIKDVNFKFVGYGNERISLGDLKGNKFKIVVRWVDEKKRLKILRVKNYFDSQRFGGNAVDVGRCLVKEEFSKVCSLLNLNVEDNNYVGALREIGRKKLRFYVVAYQSWMWNKVAEKVDNAEQIPLVGYLTEFSDKEVGECYKDLLEREGVKLDDFLSRKFPEIGIEGDERDVYVSVEDFDYNWEKDEFNEGKLKCVLEFFLRKGSYATLVVKELFPELGF